MNRNDSHTKNPKLDIAGIGVDESAIDEIIEESIASLHQPISLTPLKEIPPTLRVISKKQKKVIPRRGIVYAAAGPESVAQSKLKVMSDPLKSDTRKDLSSVAISEPNLAGSIDRRTESLFKDGINLTLELSSKFNPETGQEFTPEESEPLLAEASKDYLTHLSRLKSWKNDMHVVELMRDAEAVSFVQGKNATLMLPGILDLKQNGLPILVETIYADDLKEVIVDVGLTRKIVAVKTSLEGKKICRADELVYLVRGVKKALRRDGKFYGLSAIEAILIIAKILKRIYNYDASEAATAAYVTKILFQINSSEADDGLEGRVKNLLTEYAKRGKHAFATFDDVIGVTPIAVKVDWAMLDGIESKLAHLILAVTGVPSSMMNREQNLNRDLATIQAIQFVQFIRTPDEKLIADAFESQMFTPLLAHLAGQTVEQLPVRVKIERIAPEKDLDQIWGDSLAEKKQDEINTVETAESKAPVVPNSIFQASGPNGIKVTPKSRWKL